ncbi:hypothetical protein [Fulvitalea axinellae]|uniref:hypothetical protein n=1 Tax=Fulvitalea axinellae TaxID=1182444 RepID=UPI0030CA327E
MGKRSVVQALITAEEFERRIDDVDGPIFFMNLRYPEFAKIISLLKEYDPLQKNHFSNERIMRMRLGLLDRIEAQAYKWLGKHPVKVESVGMDKMRVTPTYHQLMHNLLMQLEIEYHTLVREMLENNYRLWVPGMPVDPGTEQTLGHKNDNFSNWQGLWAALANGLTSLDISEEMTLAPFPNLPSPMESEDESSRPVSPRERDEPYRKDVIFYFDPVEKRTKAKKLVSNLSRKKHTEPRDVLPVSEDQPMGEDESRAMALSDSEEPKAKPVKKKVDFEPMMKVGTCYGDDETSVSTELEGASVKVLSRPRSNSLDDISKTFTRAELPNVEKELRGDGDWGGRLKRKEVLGMGYHGQGKLGVAHALETANMEWGEGPEAGAITFREKVMTYFYRLMKTKTGRYLLRTAGLTGAKRAKYPPIKVMPARNVERGEADCKFPIDRPEFFHGGMSSGAQGGGSVASNVMDVTEEGDVAEDTLCWSVPMEQDHPGPEDEIQVYLSRKPLEDTASMVPVAPWNDYSFDGSLSVEPGFILFARALSTARDAQHGVHQRAAQKHHNTRDIENQLRSELGLPPRVSTLQFNSNFREFEPRETREAFLRRIALEERIRRMQQAGAQRQQPRRNSISGPPTGGAVRGSAPVGFDLLF